MPFAWFPQRFFGPKEQFQDHVQTAFDDLKQATERPMPYVSLQPTTVAPAKYRDGDMYEAKSPWNPGSGDGLYIVRGGVFVFIG